MPEHAEGSIRSRIRAAMRPVEGVLPPPPDDSPTRPPNLIERVEEALTIGFFLTMFVVILIGVWFRYVLNAPLIWTVNVSTIAFIWTIMVGSGLPNWDDEHIQFDLIYERFTPSGQRIARIVGNAIIVFTFAIAVPGTISYLRFVSVDKVTGVNLTFNWAFGGVLVFLIGTVFHRGRLLIADLRRAPAPSEPTGDAHVAPEAGL